ncbi:coiled-coil domain-containing protein 85B-like [Cebus imitator]|uniref:coiled-coil domain-containing protein 85B-like n=1 Tax=Cebus imitator TaxID=2715852 RepID=UPI000809DE41|nr:coiled-coil domain-containing protein 85B-like [Cebus imitator]
MDAEAGGLEELTDEKMATLGKEERREEATRLAALVQRDLLVEEVNRQLQGHLDEICQLRQLSRRLLERIVSCTTSAALWTEAPARAAGGARLTSGSSLGPKHPRPCGRTWEVWQNTAV